MSWFIDSFDIISTGLDLVADNTEEVVKKALKGIDDHSDTIKKAVKTKDEAGPGLLGIPFFSDDFWKLCFKFAINISVILIIVRLIYYPIAKRKDYLFTYIMISMLTFIICFALKKFDMGMGMALGLFAIFGIIRYRTDPIPIKEMTYLFIVIGVSVVNALVNKKMSYAELALTNGLVIFATFAMERLWLLKHESRKVVIYEKIDLIVPDKSAELVADLENRTGLKISRFEIGKVNFLNDTAQVFIYYYQHEQSGNYADEGISNV